MSGPPAGERFSPKPELEGFTPSPDTSKGLAEHANRPENQPPRMQKIDPIRVLFVEDSELLRTGIRAVLERPAYAERVQIVGEASSVRGALEQAKKLRPEVVLMDLTLTDGSGAEACRLILEARPATKILILTGAADQEMIFRSIAAGAQGYLLKDVPPAELVAAIEKARAGESSLSPELLSRVLAVVRTQAQQPSPIFTQLSPQEKRVLDLVAEGHTNKEIGKQLKLTENTVKNYLSNAFEKLQVSRRAQAATVYLQHRDKGASPIQA